MSNTNQFPPMAPEMSIRVFVRIARATNKTKRDWARKGLLDFTGVTQQNASRDQWMQAARIIKGYSAAYHRADRMRLSRPVV